MKYVLIDPSQTKVAMVDADDMSAVYEQVGLDKAESLDHAVVHPGISIIVDGFSLLQPPAEQRYWQLGKCLYAGAAVLYAYDIAGETIDMEFVPEILFFGSAREVEHAINRGQVIRPRTLLNDVCIWEWKP